MTNKLTGDALISIFADKAYVRLGDYNSLQQQLAAKDRVIERLQNFIVSQMGKHSGAYDTAARDAVEQALAEIDELNNPKENEDADV